jgi:hypothetical protein
MSGGRGDGGNRKIAPVGGNREVSPAAQRPVRASGPGEGVWGNREVPPATKTGLGARGHLRAAWADANLEEGGSWGKHGFPHGSEPNASDAHAATAAAMRFRSSRKATIRRALSSGESLSESTRMSGSSGFSYGSFTPVKFWSSPFIAFS